MRIKKLMAIILAVMIFAGLFSTSAMAEEAPASLVDDFEWDGETGVNSPSFGTYDGITWNQDNWWPNMGLQRLLCNTDQTATCNGVVIDFNSVEDDAFVANNVTKHLWVHPNSGYVVNNSVGTVTYDLTSLGNTNSKTFDLNVCGKGIFGVWRKTGWDGGKWHEFCKMHLAGSATEDQIRDGASWLAMLQAADEGAQISDVVPMPYYVYDNEGVLTSLQRSPDGEFFTTDNYSFDAWDYTEQKTRAITEPDGTVPMFQIQESKDGTTWTNISWKFNAVANCVSPDDWQVAQIRANISADAIKVRVIVTAPNKAWAGADDFQPGVYLFKSVIVNSEEEPEPEPTTTASQTTTTESKSESTTESKSGSPKTGDDVNIAIVFVMAAISLYAVTYLIYKKREA